MRRHPGVRCLCAAAACVALLTLRGLADEGAPRAAAPAAPTPIPAQTPVPTPTPSPLGDLSPRSYDDFLYGSAGDAFSAPAAGDAEPSWTAALDRFSVLEAVTGEPEIPDFYHS